MLVRLQILIIVLFIKVSLFAQDIPGMTFGGVTDESAYSLAKNSSGNFIIAGTSRPVSTLSTDYYINLISDSGDVLMTTGWGSSHYDFVRSILPKENGFYLIGDVWDRGDPRTSIHLSFWSYNGIFQWEKFFGTAYDEKGFKIINTKDDSLLILGYSRGYELHGDILLIKTDSLGNEGWRKNYGENHDDYGMDLLENSDGTIMVFGTVNGFFNDVHDNYTTHDADLALYKLDALGNLLWSRHIGGPNHDFGYTILPNNEDGYYLFGSTQSYGAGSFDMYLVNVDNEGETLWFKTFGSSNYDYGLSMDKSEDGSLWLTGTHRNEEEGKLEDVYIVKSDLEGNPFFEIIIGGDLNDQGIDILATSDSGCALLSTTLSYGSGGSDILFTKLDKYGNIEQLTKTPISKEHNPVNLIPNPATTSIELVSSYRPLSTGWLTIYSISGSIVAEHPINDNNTKINIENLRSGTYIFQFLDERKNIISRGKLIIH